MNKFTLIVNKSASEAPFFGEYPSYYADYSNITKKKLISLIIKYTVLPLGRGENRYDFVLITIINSEMVTFEGFMDAGVCYSNSGNDYNEDENIKKIKDAICKGTKKKLAHRKLENMKREYHIKKKKEFKEQKEYKRLKAKFDKR